MPVSLRKIEKRRVLVIAPHPDDEAIGCGGSLALHRKAGSSVRTIFVTIDRPLPSGEIVRVGEADRASKALGFDQQWLKIPDGSVSRHEPEVAEGIAKAIRETSPDVIFCPFPGDNHRDHQAAAASTAAAIAKADFGGDVWCYEVWAALWPNFFVDISSVVEEKRAAIECYRSQIEFTPYVEGVLGLNRYRGVKARTTYAEAFYVCSGRDFVNLCGMLNSF